MSQLKLFIATAIGEEFRVIKGISPQGKIKSVEIDLVQTSMGMKAAREFSQKHIDSQKHWGVLVLGYCGGLVDDLKVGTAAIASSAQSSEDLKTFSVDSKLTSAFLKNCEKKNTHGIVVPYSTQPLVIETPEDKKNLHEESKAHAVDMEMAEVFREAAAQGLPYAGVKVVIDSVDHELPNFNSHFKATGKMDDLEVGHVLARNPGLSSELAKNIKIASEILRSISADLVLEFSKQCQK